MSLLYAALCLAAMKPHLLWADASPEQAADTRVAFRGTFNLEQEAEVELRLLAASWYSAWIDGEFLAEGPARYALSHPEYATVHKKLKPGKHVLAVEVLNEGVATRIMAPQQPFLFAEIPGVEIAWKCARIGGHSPRVRRINPQLGWIEWCDTRFVPNWQEPSHVDEKWAAPVEVGREIGEIKPQSMGNIYLHTQILQAVASGDLTETFGYEQDDPAARFFLRDLKPKETPPQGVWRRYDLGKIALWRPRVTLDVPKGSVVEFAYSESLQQGRVSPWITLSAGPSCNLDHYIARGGKQTFGPLVPRGGRYIEVHVLAPSAEVKFLEEKFISRRNYFGSQINFESGDILLDKIWKTGVSTLESCAEDAVIDNPTRERGQWAGDLMIGMEVAGASQHDLRLFRRGLVQCAQSARGDGLVAGMCPGQNIFLSSYAAMWPGACLRYWELTGDRSLLDETFEAAERNIAAFEAKRTERGIENALAWAFVDWGYVASEGPCDIAMNLFYLDGLRQMARWSRAVDREPRAKYYEGLAAKQKALLAAYFESELKQGWEKVGYHRAALGLKLGFFSQPQAKECVAFLKRHMLRCFPNDPSAPRLSDPGVGDTRLITPYFAHFVMPLLIEYGEADFVLDQYRKCWGWMLEGGRTTWMEVFDTRWSGCHQWSGCPTWQLSRYTLGLKPRFDLGPNEFELTLNPGGLKKAKGRVPLRADGEWVDVSWERKGAGFEVTLVTKRPTYILVGKEKRKVHGKAVFTIPG